MNALAVMKRRKIKQEKSFYAVKVKKGTEDIKKK